MSCRALTSCLSCFVVWLILSISDCQSASFACVATWFLFAEAPPRPAAASPDRSLRSATQISAFPCRFRSDRLQTTGISAGRPSATRVPPAGFGSNEAKLAQPALFFSRGAGRGGGCWPLEVRQLARDCRKKAAAQRQNKFNSYFLHGNRPSSTAIFAERRLWRAGAKAPAAGMTTRPLSLSRVKGSGV